jgi:AraC-like DNA-binding protein
LELLYLSWGRRWMGEHPIPLAMHEGWVYAVILEGVPVLQFQSSQRPTKPGDVFIFHPDCAYGWQDLPKNPSKLMTWLWRTPPTHTHLVPTAEGFLHIRATPKLLRQIVAIHQRCMLDVAAADETALLSLRRARLDLDISLASTLKQAEPPDPRIQMNLALHFLQQNPGCQHPAKCLCEHLNIAPSTLRSHFQKYCGRSPQAVAMEFKMNYAKDRLSQPNTSVKEVAYELGYRHPNDLSRAFKSHFGRCAR